MRAISRRLTNTAIRLVGRSPNDYAEELQRFLEKIAKQVFGGIPAGFNDVSPTQIEADTVSSPGSQTEGWAAADHAHPVLTASAGELGDVSSEGTSPALSRADHAHKRTVRVLYAGVDVGTRNAIDIIPVDPGVQVAVDDNPGGDKIEIRVSINVAREELLFYAAFISGV